nr:acyltransferase [Acidimicrobiia bacterium]
MPVSDRPRVVPARAPVRRTSLGLPDGGFRADVEGLRAVAVVAVVAFHLRLGGFAGGFVGVDVFFVVSGYLITRLLLSEVGRTGRISLPAFWARRARRLLPASALVLVVTVVASRWMLNPLAQRSVAADALAAGGFVVNFVFANRLGDYFGAQLGALEPSPLLHVWSLAVEEQFYLLWPVTLLLLTRRPRQYRRLVLAVVLGVAVASLVASVWMTDHHPTWAFYLLPARMFELLAGAAVAVAGGAFTTVNAMYRAALGWFGLAGILVAVGTYDASTPFPGTAALLPVLCTVLVLTAGGRGGAASGPVLVLGHPVAGWIGTRSYSIYLWHWPALVLGQAKFGPLGLPSRVVVVAASVGLAALTYRIVENPVRHHRWLAARPGRGLALG